MSPLDQLRSPGSGSTHLDSASMEQWQADLLVQIAQKIDPYREGKLSRAKAQRAAGKDPGLRPGPFPSSREA